MTTPRIILFVLLSASWAGCSCSDVNLGDDDGGLSDVGRGPQRLDECGNGLDDDGNGAIDDGCPCAPGETQRCFSGALAAHEVGACMGGTQVCDATAGSEWGDWGSSACEGERLPSSETCDGSDADCDGATDEGCPCTEGMTRGCGTEFVVAPCMAGSQACRGGSWSSCEGAIGPSADVCDDDVDNDCDGLTNEGCDCPSPPVPEVCRDAVDNDCDGEIDEPACTPDWSGDAGTVDAGCSGLTEACGNGYDDDCDTRIDESCSATCEPPVVGPPIVADLGGSHSRSYFGEHVMRAAYNPDTAELGVLYAWQNLDATMFDVRLLRFGLDGALHGTTTLDTTTSPNEIAGLSWAGGAWVGVWNGARGASSVRAARIRGDGVVAVPARALATPVVAHPPAAMAVGADLFVVWGEEGAGHLEPTRMMVGRFDDAFSAAASPIELGPLIGRADLAWSDGTLAVIDVSSLHTSPPTMARISFVRGDVLVAQDQMIVDPDAAALLPPAIAASGTSFLACWPGTSSASTALPLRCARATEPGFSAAPFDATSPVDVKTGDVAWDGCRYLAYAARTNARSDLSQSIALVDEAGSVSSRMVVPYALPRIYDPDSVYTVSIPAATLVLGWNRGLTGNDVITIRRVE